jgi:hypothetical protein
MGAYLFGIRQGQQKNILTFPVCSPTVWEKHETGNGSGMVRRPRVGTLRKSGVHLPGLKNFRCLEFELPGLTSNGNSLVLVAFSASDNISGTGLNFALVSFGFSLSAYFQHFTKFGIKFIYFCRVHILPLILSLAIVCYNHESLKFHALIQAYSSSVMKIG